MAKSAKKSVPARPQGLVSAAKPPATGKPGKPTAASERTAAKKSDSPAKPPNLESKQAHSVRGFLAGVVRKRMKLKLTSKKMDGTRVYRIAGGADAKVDSRQPKRRAA